MVTKKIRSEYMKKFKDPKWETYAKCYEDSLKYRLTRRLLEQTHRPWFWEDCHTDSDSSGTSTPKGRRKGAPGPKTKEATPPAPETQLGQQEAQLRENQETEAPATEASTAREPPQAGTAGSDKSPPAALQGSVSKDRPGERSGKEGLGGPPLEGHQKGAVQSCRPRKPTRAKSQPREVTDTDKENRHPFALYGSGEKQAEMGTKRTHNVGPYASTREIHPSALRAKTRREVEKQLKVQARRRARSADVEKTHKADPIPEYDPWMTEYMRCFSVRSR